MTVWVVRAGRYGEREETALEQGLCFIGWGEMPDLTGMKSRNAVEQKLSELYPDRKEGTLKNHAIQIWSFLSNINKGDIIALPLKNRPAIAFGKALDEYIYMPNNPEDMRHAKKVKWIGEPILRSRLDQDLKYSFGASQTVFSYITAQ
jgi:restriction system protein